VESIVGRGTSVYVILPVTSNLAAGDPTALDAPVRNTPRVRRPVAIVEDEPALARVMNEHFDILGFDVSLYTDAVVAARALSAPQPGVHLVITDQTMPGLSGLDLARTILAAHPRLPVILCTGYSRAVNHDQAIDIGIRAFVDKPVELDALAALAVQLLDENE
jgi:DNA-binding NtrC family response regulator